MDRKELIDLMCKSQLTNQQFMDIYDEMRSRTCENCKYYEVVGSPPSAWCNNDENKHVFGHRYLLDDFGCNKFERKDEG